MTLGTAAQHRAVAFLRSEARPLEWARHAFHFENAGRDPMTSALAMFQNADGGFGHGMEPDLTLPNSSVLCTTRALQTLVEVDTPPDHPLVSGGIRYLLASYDRAKCVWEIVPRTANDYPHAGWWHYDDANQSAKWHDYLVNPRAEIVGCLHHYAVIVPEAVLCEVTDSLLAHVASHDGPNDMHEICCCLKLVETPPLPEPLRRRLVEAIAPVVASAVERDPARWSKYCLKPAGYMGVVNSPRSPLAPMLDHEVQTCLDCEIGRQQPDGSWHPTWSWGNDYPDAWQRAKLAWQGILTVNMLVLLSDFGRLVDRRGGGTRNVTGPVRLRAGGKP